MFLICAGAIESSLCRGAENFPDWLFPVAPAASNPTPQDSTHRLSNRHSRLHYTQTELNDPFNAPDWFPESHDAMPDVVAHGRKPDVLACAFCHTSTGQGRPENASLAGLSSAYMARQLEELRVGARKQEGPVAYAPVRAMVEIASHLTDEEIRIAADYFSKQALHRRVEVKESENLPCVKPAFWIYLKSDGCEGEPLGMRLIELAPDKTPHELRDESMVYVAIVPVGSIARGQALSHEGDAARACSTCHGEKLHGTDIAPSLAGRSPTSLLRQLLAFQQRTRMGERAVLMQPVVENMSMSDMIAAAAYAASLDP